MDYQGTRYLTKPSRLKVCDSLKMHCVIITPEEVAGLTIVTSNTTSSEFFAHGACLKGEHDWKDPTNNICTYYQRGICSYGSRCRYEHVKEIMDNYREKLMSIDCKHFNFVVPSVIWFSAPEEKKEIMDNYREKLRSIDCKHFNFGDGNCPFGTSCFYKHTVKPGSYAWKYHRPPPRHPRPSRSNFSDVDTLVNMIGNIISEVEYGPIVFEDGDDEELSTTDMMKLLMHMDMASEDSSNEDGY